MPEAYSDRESDCVLDRESERTPDRFERGTDRAQSEPIGFLLIFGIVILTILLVGATGYVGLDNAKDFQRTTNAEQAFTALAENVDDIARHGAPRRTTEIRLAGASLSVEGTEKINVTVEGETRSIETQPIVYDTGSGTAITYASGALIREDGGNGVMIRQPGFRLTTDVVILPIVVTSPLEVERVGGTSKVEVGTRRSGTEVVNATDNLANSTVVVQVTSPRVETWKQYFDEETDANCDDPVGNSVTCEIDTQRAYVSIEYVEVEFI